MKREEMIKNLEQDIIWRKDSMIRGIENELQYLQKYLEELKKSESVADVLNNARAVQSYAYQVNQSAENSFNTMNELRLGLYYLGNCEE